MSGESDATKQIVTHLMGIPFFDRLSEAEVEKIYSIFRVAKYEADESPVESPAETPVKSPAAPARAHGNHGKRQHVRPRRSCGCGRQPCDQDYGPRETQSRLT
jgi:hypothetical protein